MLALVAGRGLTDTLTASEADLLALVGASGFAMQLEDTRLSLGEVPPSAAFSLRVPLTEAGAAWVGWYRDDGTSWRSDEVELAQEFGRFLSSVVVRLERDHNELAGVLHRSLLLPSLPAIEGVDLCVRYQPGGGGVVGGDWYDIVSLPDGSVALVVGDVAGHGVASSAAMGQLRNGLRAYLVDDPDPGRALARLNLLALQLLPAEMATAIVAIVDVGARIVRLASAGHLPPLVVASPGPCAASDAAYAEISRVPALGLADPEPRPATLLAVEPGTVMLFFTDGLVERRGAPIDVGLEQLRSLVVDELRAGTADLDSLCDRVLTLVPDHPDADDVAVLAIRFT